MTMKSVLEETHTFLDQLGLSEEPFGVYYDDTKPDNAFGPKPGIPISRELEAQGNIDMQEMFKCFSCVIGNIWLARKKASGRLYFHGRIWMSGGRVLLLHDETQPQIHRALCHYRL